MTIDDNPPKDATRLPLHTKILIGLVLGAVLGLAANYFFSTPEGIDERLDWLINNVTDLIGKIFLRLMFMVVLPLVFSALALAVWEIGDVRRLGRAGTQDAG